MTPRPDWEPCKRATITLLLENLRLVEFTGGMRSICFMQLLLFLCSNLECTHEDCEALVTILKTLIKQLNFDEKNISDVVTRSRKHEVLLLYLRFFNILVSRKKLGADDSKSTYASHMLWFATARTLLKDSKCLDICRRTLRAIMNKEKCLEVVELELDRIEDVRVFLSLYCSLCAQSCLTMISWKTSLGWIESEAKYHTALLWSPTTANGFQKSLFPSGALTVRRFPGFAQGNAGGKRVEQKFMPSGMCWQFMMRNFDEVCRLVLKYSTSRNPLIQQILLALLPRIAALNQELFA